FRLLEPLNLRSNQINCVQKFTSIIQILSVSHPYRSAFNDAEKTFLIRVVIKRLVGDGRQDIVQNLSLHDFHGCILTCYVVVPILAASYCSQFAEETSCAW